MGLGVIGAAHGVYRICNHVLLLRLPLSDSSAKHWHAEREPPCDVHAQSLEPPAVSLAAVLTTCADRRGGCRTCWLAPRSSLAHVRECPPSLTSVCPVIHSSTSPITHSTRLAISCGRRCWPPTNPKPHPTPSGAGSTRSLLGTGPATASTSCRQRVGQDFRWPETRLGACRDDTRGLARHRRRRGRLVSVPTRTWWERQGRGWPPASLGLPGRGRDHAARPGHHDRGDPGAARRAAGTTN